MNKALTTMVAGALVLGAAVPAFAQDKPLGLSVRIGGFISTGDSAKASADSMFSAGVDYKLGSLLSSFGNSALSLSLDVAGKGNFRTVPLTLNYTVRGMNGLYGFAGAGISWTREGFADGTSEDKTRFAYQAGLGWDFQQGQFPLFVEAKYMGTDRSSLNGVGVYVGVRF